LSSHKKNTGSHAGSTSTLHQKLHGDATETADNGQNADIDADLLETEKLSYSDLQKKMLAAEEKANTNWERVLRMQADMDNAQRRSERDVANAHKYSLEKFVSELLPVVDNLERSLHTSEEEHSGNSVLEGIKLTLKMFITALEKFQVIQIDPLGETFNPEFHQAVSVQEDPAASPNTVLSVLQKGYLLNNRLVRPALVVVSKA
jgi:molecular chaperone GrpE